jgi:hypothetical protein
MAACKGHNVNHMMWPMHADVALEIANQEVHKIGLFKFYLVRQFNFRNAHQTNRFHINNI